MMDEFSMTDTRVLRTTQSDRDMRSLVITTKLKHLEAQVRCLRVLGLSVLDHHDCFR
jgi:hypothetical protein